MPPSCFVGTSIERRQRDAEHRTLNEYLSAAERGLDLSRVPVFLSSQRTPLKPNHFRDNFWTPACKALARPSPLDEGGASFGARQ
jgi:hypothetical protein